MYTVVTVLLGVGAINSQNNLLFLLFGAALGAMLVSGLVSGSMMMRVGVRRDAPAVAQVGRPLRVVYRVANTRARFPAMGVHVIELDADRRAIAQPLRAFVAAAKPRERTPAGAITTPLRRGPLSLNAVRLSTTFPFGIVRKSVDFARPASVLVRPGVTPLDRGALDRLTAVGRGMEDAAHKRGRGLEFFGLRDYTPGDPLRSIDWRASARTGQLHTRQTVAPVARSVVLMLHLDTGPTDRGAEHPVERAIALAASLAAALIDRQLRVGLVAPRHRISIPVGAGAAHLGSMLDALALVDASADDPERAVRINAAAIPDDAQRIGIASSPDAATGASDQHTTLLLPSDLDRLASQADPSADHPAPAAKTTGVTTSAAPSTA
jgi:uncharacterized protein (DUF58 family)